MGIHCGKTYHNTLAFSVGCHSGLNVPDAAFNDASLATDWAQAFARQKATFLGNTGYGYGDGDLIAYSERLMTNFTRALGDWSEGPQTVGRALLRAKQSYFNHLAAGGFSNYDEKVLGEMTLYGLPMLQVNMPVTTTTPVASTGLLRQSSAMAGGLPSEAASGQFRTSLNLHLNYTVNTTSRGKYYTVSGQNEVHVSGGRPVEPRTSLDLARSDGNVQGVLLTGGSFEDIPDFDPLISRLVTDTQSIWPEPAYPITREWYPARLATLNQFLGIDALSRERLVLVPGQFIARHGSTPTIGTQRLYHDLSFDVYYAPFETADFTPPVISGVTARRKGNQAAFEVQVGDESGSVERVIVLYRQLNQLTWSKAELAYNGSRGIASGSVYRVSGELEYFVQAVDSTGNVALVLDHGVPFLQAAGSPEVYLPLVRR